MHSWAIPSVLGEIGDPRASEPPKKVLRSTNGQIQEAAKAALEKIRAKES
jgi:HEAT repeat protein